MFFVRKSTYDALKRDLDACHDLIEAQDRTITEQNLETLKYRDAAFDSEHRLIAARDRYYSAEKLIGELRTVLRQKTDAACDALALLNIKSNVLSTARRDGMRAALEHVASARERPVEVKLPVAEEPSCTGG